MGTNMTYTTGSLKDSGDRREGNQEKEDCLYLLIYSLIFIF